ncbi:MAG: hypothetical protein NT062_32945 [Proteobacteria bacterium]|nr:hypothetical protein [Pseudomonadota bacterium]
MPAFAKDAKDTKDASKKPAAPTVQPKRLSLATCTTFDQTDKDEDTVQFAIKSTCTIPIDCSISWKLVCAPASKSRRVEHAKSAAFAGMNNESSRSADASAAECGADSWAIESVQWACTPNND